jgi:hypothetical protein
MTTSPAQIVIALLVHICDQRRSYVVRFYGPQAEDHALAFIAARYEAKGPNGYGNHVITEDHEEPINWVALYGDDRSTGPLYDLLYPTCEHGLSLALCAGPQHYPYDDEERAHYGF